MSNEAAIKLIKQRIADIELEIRANEAQIAFLTTTNDQLLLQAKELQVSSAMLVHNEERKVEKPIRGTGITVDKLSELLRESPGMTKFSIVASFAAPDSEEWKAALTQANSTISYMIKKELLTRKKVAGEKGENDLYKLKK